MDYHIPAHPLNHYHMLTWLRKTGYFQSEIGYHILSNTTSAQHPQLMRSAVPNACKVPLRPGYHLKKFQLQNTCTTMIIWMPKMTRIMPNELLHKVQNFGSNSTGPEAGLIITRSLTNPWSPLDHPLNLGSGSTGPEAGLTGALRPRTPSTLTASGQ